MRTHQGTTMTQAGAPRVWAALLASAMFLFILVTAVPSAQAATCVVNGSWSDNCLTSKTSNQISDLTVAIQTVINHDCLSGNAGTIDGYFGSNTEDAVEDFQNAVGVGSDGMVGSDTWPELRDQLDWHATTATYYYYDLPCLTSSYPNVGGDDVAFRYIRSNANWQVYSTHSGSWVTIDSTRTS